jgi:plasmid stabilization system protein ParE
VTEVRPPTPLSLTHRAVSDIRSIALCSTEQWDQAVAERYIDDLEAALVRCSEHPGLMLGRSDLHPNLRFYSVNQHILVCDVTEDSIVVLTVANAKTDLISRLAHLEPMLATEVEILRARHRGPTP